MANAAIDANSRQTITARLNTDVTQIVRIKCTTTGHIDVDDAMTGAPGASDSAATDDNDRPTMFAVSNSDSTVLVALVANSAGALLVNSN